MNNYVFVVKSPYDERTGNGIYAHCDKKDIYLGLPEKCDYADEMDVNEINLDELEDDDIFREFFPRITRSLGRIDVLLSVKEVREYLLAFLQALKEIHARAYDSLSLVDAASALCDPYCDLRIQDGDLQYDAISWLYKKLVEVDRNAEDSIVFEIVQAFSYNYAKGEEN